MAYKPITVEEILETLSDKDKEEVLRDDFSIPVKRYLDGFNSGAFTNRRQIIVDNLRSYARNRSAVRNEITRNPAVANTPVDRPLVIIGMPRSGTTLLHRLLSSDTQFLSPMFWEMIQSVPPGRPENWRECERFKKTLEIEAFKGLESGAFDHVHKLRLDLDAECLVIMQHFLIDTVEPLSLECLHQTRDFMYNCPEEHTKKLYEFHKMIMKCMFYGIHIFNSNDDIHGVGQRSMEYVKHCATRLVQSLKTWPKDCYINIAYTDLVQNPMDTVKKIYSHFNMPLTPEAEGAMQRYLQENPQNKHGKHEYSLEEFGITEDDIKKDFGEYLEYFKNGNEPLL